MKGRIPDYDVIFLGIEVRYIFCRFTELLIGTGTHFYCNYCCRRHCHRYYAVGTQEELCDLCCLYVCLSVCLSFCERDNSRVHVWMLSKRDRHGQFVTVLKVVNFGVDLNSDMDLRSLFHFT